MSNQNGKSAGDPIALIHELRVHQQELESQNEELLRTQAELAESRDRYAGLYDFSPIGYLTIDQDGIVRESNLTTARILGVPRKLLLGRRFVDFISLGRDRFLSHSRAVLKGKGKDACEVMLRRKDGSTRILQLESIKAGDPAECRTVLIDVTVAKQRNTQLQQLAAELTLAEQRERDRLAQLLHDHVQQLLFAAMLDLGRIHHEGDPVPQHAEVLNVARGSLTQALETVRSLSTQLSPPVLQEGLIPAISWLAEWVRKAYDLQVDLELHDKGAPEDESVCLLCFLAVRELLLNVVKHAHVRTAQVRLSANGHNEACIVVADRGKGFDTTLQGRVKSPVQTYGLANLENRIQLIGGRFEIQSAPEGGTVVSIWVPCRRLDTAAQSPGAQSPGAQSPGAQSPGAQSPGAQSVRILVVEGHRLVRESLTKILELEKHFTIVGTTGSGISAVEMTRHLHPDVVIMDVKTGFLNGIDATYRIREICPKVHVIGLSVSEDDRGAMLDAGAIAYFRKTGPLQDVIDAIHAVTWTSVDSRPEGVSAKKMRKGSSGHLQKARRAVSTAKPKHSKSSR